MAWYKRIPLIGRLFGEEGIDEEAVDEEAIGLIIDAMPSEPVPYVEPEYIYEEIPEIHGDVNDSLSYKDFTGQSLKHLDPAEFNGREIVGSCFWQENKPDSDIFPDGIEGTIFTRCNLGNVLIPPMCYVNDDCSYPRVKVQNDAEDWVIDEDNNPIEPLNKKRFIAEGKSLDPKNIPTDFYREEEISKWYWDNTFGKGQMPYKSWFRELPEILESTTKEVTMEVEKYYSDVTYGCDNVPVKTGEVTRYQVVGLVNGRPQKLDKPIPKQLTQLRGTKTIHKVRGKAWLYRGQEKE